MVVNQNSRIFKDLEEKMYHFPGLSRIFKDIAQISRISRFFKDRGNHVLLLDTMVSKTISHEKKL